MLLPSQLFWNLLVGSAFMALYVWICSLLARRNAGFRAWCLPLGVILSTTYLYGMQVSGSVVYGGITGDNSFEIAHINNVIAGNCLGDAYTKTVPADYSLLYFWVLGAIARLASLDPIAVWRFAPFVVLLCLPFLVYQIGRNLGEPETGFWSCVSFFGLGAMHIQLFLTSSRRWGTYGLVLIKPHEVVAALVLLYWFIVLVRKAPARETALRSLLLSGITGAFLVLTYYPIFVLGLAAVAIHALAEKDPARRRAILIHAGSFGLLGLMLSLPAWLPYASALATRSHEPAYRAEFLTLWNLDPTMYTLGMGYLGALFILGMFALKDFLTDRRIRIMLIFVAMCYLMILATFILYPLAGLILLPQKWSEFLMVALGVLSGRGLQILLERLRLRPGRFLVFMVLLLFIPSPLSWNRLTDNELGSGGRDRQLLAVAREIVAASRPLADAQSVTVLSTPPLAYALPAVSHWRLYLAPNIHYATPLALHKWHAGEVQRLGSAGTPGELDRLLDGMGIGLLVMGQGEDELLLEVDREARAISLLSGASRQSSVVRVPKHLLTAPYFSKVYEDQQVIAFLRAAGSAGPAAR